jgi:predicted flap endonuclease-1-like 5' DNA nuclease
MDNIWGIAFWIVVGVIIGWVIEWIIDWRFWRRGDGDVSAKLAQAEAENRRLQTQSTEAERKLALLAASERDVGICETKLADAEATLERLRTELNLVASQAPQEEDCFERIQGFSTTFADRFNDAEIYTFVQLADSPPERVHEVARPEEWQKIEPQSWIAQARELATEKAEASRCILQEYREHERLQEKLVYLEAENGRLQEWLAAGAALRLAEAEAPAGQGEVGLAQFSPDFGQMPQRRDNLEEIDGIGPVYAQRLNEAGVFSFWHLSQLTPEQVGVIIGPAGWQKIEPESWIAQAQVMADPDPLEVIDGIGPVYARRLNEAGIYTFAQLAELTSERIQKFVEAQGWQYVNAESWIAQARELAAKKSVS